MKKTLTQILFSLVYLVYSVLIAVLIFWIFPEKISGIHLLAILIIIFFMSFTVTKDHKNAKQFLVDMTVFFLLCASVVISFIAWQKNIIFRDWLKLFISVNGIILLMSTVLYFVGSATKKVFFQTPPKENLIKKIHGCIYEIFYAHINTHNWRAKEEDQIYSNTFGQWYMDEILFLEKNPAEREKLVELIIEKFNAVFFNMPKLEEIRHTILKSQFLSSPPLSRVTQVSINVFIFYLYTFLEYVLKKHHAENFNRKTIHFVFETIKKWGVPFNKKDIRTILSSKNTGYNLAKYIYASIETSADN